MATELLPTSDAGHLECTVVAVATGASRILSGDETITVGSSQLCDLVIEDRTVSRRHASLRLGRSGIVVRDQGSQNGTWSGETKVLEAEIPLGSEIRVGMSTLRFEPKASARSANKAEMPSHFGRFIGNSQALRKVYDTLSRAIATDLTVLIEGESGCGKELLSEAVHTQSNRADGPFVVVDCGSIPATLIESELFGHERGAFTNATDTRIGAFEQAHGGTVFLDEVGELPLAMQTRLLRFLDRRQVRRIGAQDLRTVDVRIVAATNRDLDAEVEAGRFRLDLFHRLAVAYVRVPPLRERQDDLELLSRHLWVGLGGAPEQLTAEMVERIKRRPWMGNVRELRNHLHRTLVLGSDFGEAVQAVDLGDVNPATLNVPYRQARAIAIEAFTQKYVAAMLERHNGNVSRAAEAAEIARRYFQRLKSR